jgi:uncharacterized membrane protein YebE (DUF533 family)
VTSPSGRADGDGSFLAVIRVWAATAWADGRIDAAESEAMKRLIAVAALSDDDRSTAIRYLHAPVELETAELAGLGEQQRQGIYRAAVRLSRIDREVAPEETAFLGRLRDGLGLDAAVARAIEAAVD